MSHQELVVAAIIGGAFLILGIIGFLWSHREEGAWYKSVSTKIDVREFLNRNPGQQEPKALRTGGKICIAVGIIVLLVDLGFFMFNR
jgi:glycerol-3-phosphate acyltransferase PlsY